MRLGEKEYFRIFAYQQLTKNDDTCKMSLVSDHVMDYKNVISQPSRVHRRMSSLVFAENPEKNLIFFRPLEIKQGDHMELIFMIKENMAPFLAEIGSCGRANDFPRNVIVINHTQTVIRFDGNADQEYEVSVECRGEKLDPLLEEEYLENTHPEKFREYMTELIEKRRDMSRDSQEKLRHLRNEEKQLKCQVSDLEQQLQELQNREQSDRKHVEANEADILEKEKLSRKIADWLPSRRRIIQDIMNDLEMTSKERQRKKESCQKHIEFLINIEKYYKEQKKDEKFTEILQSIKTDAEELDAYYLKLEEIEQNRSTEEEERGTAVKGIQEDIS